jgi:hypothetical protein
MYSVCGLFEGAKESDGKSDSILKIESCFGSVGSGKSEIDYAHLYLNRGVFSIKIQSSGNW